MLTSEGIHSPGWLRLAEDLIVDVGPGTPPGSVEVDLGDATVVPGFVDVHVHGGGSASFQSGSDEDVARVAAFHLSHGTTTMLASLVTDSVDRLSGIVARLSASVRAGLLAGIHLEGPWLSPAHAGAHDPSLLVPPTPGDLDRLLAAGDDTIRMVTLAPELPGGLEAVRRLTESGVVAALGHTDATYDQARAALDAGAAGGTHVFNAMRGEHHREPGPVTALLEHPEAWVELIADGVHLHPAVLGLTAAHKPRRTLLVTDAMAAAGAGDGDYELGSMSVEVRGGVARLPGGAIAGSTLTMAAAVRYAVTVAGLPLEDAVRAATATPATALGLERVGSLRPGFRADLVVLDGSLDVTRVMRGGAWVSPGT